MRGSFCDNSVYETDIQRIFERAVWESRGDHSDDHMSCPLYRGIHFRQKNNKNRGVKKNRPENKNVDK